MDTGESVVTYYKTVTLYCDCDGCEHCGESTECRASYEYDRSGAMEARRNAANLGWKYECARDYCRGCWKHQ